MLADAQNFARLDRNSQIREETERARAAGMAEESTEQKLEIAKKMKERGYSTSGIESITELTKEEIEKI